MMAETETAKEQWYVVSVDRTTTYRVKASSDEDAIEEFIGNEGTEIDQITVRMRAELDEDQTVRVPPPASGWTILEGDGGLPVKAAAIVSCALSVIETSDGADEHAELIGELRGLLGRTS
jgi:hypothetical protein